MKYKIKYYFSTDYLNAPCRASAYTPWSLTSTLQKHAMTWGGARQRLIDGLLARHRMTADHLKRIEQAEQFAGPKPPTETIEI